MVKVFEAADLLQAHFVRNLLVREGIRAVVLGEQLQSGAGFVPLVRGALPQVWVGEAQRLQATQIVERYLEKDQARSPRSANAWICPSCGERLEPQFTECWKCGESRPQNESTPVDEEPALGKYLDIEILCTRCEYNLLGLEPSGKCPECGRPVLLSMLAAAQRLSLGSAFDLDALSRFIDRTLQESGYPSAAVLFLLDAWPRALDALSADVDVPKQAQAIKLCWNVVDVAIAEYEGVPEAMAMFRAWGFIDCQSLAASLFALIARDWLAPTKLFVLEDFPPVPIESIFPPNKVSDVQL